MTIYGETIDIVNDTDATGNLDLTIQNIRYIINIPEPDELSNNVIIMALNRSNVKINSLVTLYGLTGDLIDVAKLAYAAYLSYEAYSDRVFNVITGKTTRDGAWDPIAQEIVRITTAKLKSLKDESDSVIADLIATAGSDGTISSSMVIPTISKTKDSLYYPIEYMTSDEDYPLWEYEDTYIFEE